MEYLENLPKIRVKKYPKGYVAEIQKRKWWGKKYWVHITCVAGIREMPWHYKTAEKCIEDVTHCFKYTLTYNYKFKQKWNN